MAEIDLSLASDPAGASDALPPLVRIDQHSKTLDRAVRLTQMADAKTAPILALQATLAAVTVSQASDIGRIMDFGEHPYTTALALLVMLAYVGTALFACVLGVLVFVPRAPRISPAGPDEPLSLVYFDDISRVPFEAFRAKALTVGRDAFEEDILQQVHIVSGVASRKMSLVRIALLATLFAFLAWLPLMAWARA